MTGINVVGELVVYININMFLEPELYLDGQILQDFQKVNHQLLRFFVISMKLTIHHFL